MRCIVVSFCLVFVAVGAPGLEAQATGSGGSTGAGAVRGAGDVGVEPPPVTVVEGDLLLVDSTWADHSGTVWRLLEIVSFDAGKSTTVHELLFTVDADTGVLVRVDGGKNATTTYASQADRKSVEHGLEKLAKGTVDLHQAPLGVGLIGQLGVPPDGFDGLTVIENSANDSVSILFWGAGTATGFRFTSELATLADLGSDDGSKSAIEFPCYVGNFWFCFKCTCHATISPPSVEVKDCAPAWFQGSKCVIDTASAN